MSQAESSGQVPKRSEWRLISKNEGVFNYESIKLCIEVIFVKHKPIFVTITDDRKEIRLSLVGYLRKNYLEELLKRHNAFDNIELRGVMNDDRLVNDHEAHEYWIKKWPHDKQPEGYEDVKLTEGEIAKIMNAIGGNSNIFIIYLI